MVEGAVAAVVEVVVNKRRKKFKSRKVRRARIRSFSSGWLVNGLGLHGLGLLGCVASLCFILAVMILIFIVSRVFDVRAGQSLTLVVAACVSGGLFYLGVKLHGKTSGNFYGGGGSCSGCSGAVSSARSSAAIAAPKAPTPGTTRRSAARSSRKSNPSSSDSTDFALAVATAVGCDSESRLKRRVPCLDTVVSFMRKAAAMERPKIAMRPMMYPSAMTTRALTLRWYFFSRRAWACVMARISPGPSEARGSEVSAPYFAKTP